MTQETELARVLRIGRERQEEAASVRFLQQRLVIAACNAEGDGVWFDSRTAPPFDQGRVAAHIWYLEERGLLDRHPKHREWVRCWERV